MSSCGVGLGALKDLICLMISFTVGFSYIVCSHLPVGQNYWEPKTGSKSMSRIISG